MLSGLASFVLEPVLLVVELVALPEPVELLLCVRCLLFFLLPPEPVVIVWSLLDDVVLLALELGNPGVAVLVEAVPVPTPVALRGVAVPSPGADMVPGVVGSVPVALGNVPLVAAPAGGAPAPADAVPVWASAGTTRPAAAIKPMIRIQNLLKSAEEGRTGD